MVRERWQDVKQELNGWIMFAMVSSMDFIFRKAEDLKIFKRETWQDFLIDWMWGKGEMSKI